MPIIRDRVVGLAPTSAGIKRGDQVKVITGRDRGKTGRVLAIDPGKRTITVEHAGIIKRHTRPNPSKNVKGGIVEKEGPLPISNVQLLCPACNKATRIGHKLLPDGTKDRVCRRCGNTLEK
ncbi:MAG TPA: 50S ribosomal protein L24 [Candidatus Sulfotelmatobacter sp.]|jgi:large subunit ribosomal protein L24|nr:50S ribosomal protein L24 [Candidatus Sulfotelmatobacter sp.]